MKRILTIGLITLALSAASFSLAHAQNVADLGAGKASGSSGTCSGNDPLSTLFCNGNLPSALNALFQLSISVGALLAMLRIGYGGYLYMGSADMWSSKTHAKEVFRDAIIGLLLLLAIWLILYQINPCILDLSVLNTGSGQCSGVLPGGTGASPY